MNYTKPEVAVLGQAVHVIEGSQTKSISALDGAGKLPRNKVAPPAYDLDE